MLNSILNSTTGEIDLVGIIICTVVSLVLGFVISLVHKLTSSYNKNFLITIAVLPVLVQSVIMLVNGNLGTSIATLGAFSLVRFRSLPGTSKEILTVFFAMTIGLATGMGHIAFAGIITLIACAALVLLNYVKLFDNNKSERLLKITIPENLDYTNVFEDEFNKYTNSVALQQVKTTNMGSLFELSYKVKLKKDINEKEFLDDIRIKNGNLKVMLNCILENGEL